MAESPETTSTNQLKIREWWVVYHDRDYRITRFLKPGFRHVELARKEGSHWLHVLPTFETLDVELADSTPPWERCPEATIQLVRASRPLYHMRSWFDIGPPTCVEVAKMVLGIRDFWLRTPWQLFKHIDKRGGVLG